MPYRVGASSHPRKSTQFYWWWLLTWGVILLGLIGSQSSVLAQQLAQPGGGTAEPEGATIAHKLVLCTDGTIRGWGDNGGGQLGNNPSSVPTPVPIAFGGPPVVRVVVASQRSFAICSDGSLWVWGSGNSGQLGLGSGITSTSTPTQVVGIGNVIDVSGGFEHTMALCSDGTVWTWGRRLHGVLGTGPTGSAIIYAPQQIPSSSLSGIRSIASGDQFCLALAADGHIWSWGVNSNGELGLTGIIQGATQYTPAQIQLNNVRQIDAGNVRSSALLTDGTVWNWGRNQGYQLGLGHTNYVGVPAQVGIGVITDATWIAMNTEAAVAVNRDGSTYVWGLNNYGSLGRATPAVAQVPVAGPLFSPNTQVTGIYFQFTSIDNTGLVKTWGGEPLGYTPVLPTSQFGGSYFPTTPANLCPAVPTADFPACGPQRAYYQSSAASYEAARHGYTVSAAEIGQPGAITLIDVSQAPYNGTLVFDGIYHLQGTVRFMGGRVVLNPGTTFYVDGRDGQGADEFTTELQVKQASLLLTGATLQASCDVMWGGIHLLGNARIYSSAYAATEGDKPQDTEIRDAYRGIFSDLEDGVGYGTRNSNQYYLDHTRFINNVIGFYDMFKGTVLPGEGITNCIFSTDVATAKPSLGAATGAGTGIVLNPLDPSSNFGGDYSAATFTGNSFSRLTTGLRGVGKQLSLVNNTFSSCWYVAVNTEGFNTFAAPMSIRYCTFTVPAALPNGGTVAYGLIGNASVSNCTFQGATADPTTNAVRQIGLTGYQQDNSILQDNTFRLLDYAVEQRVEGNDGPGFSNNFVHNLFSNNIEGLRFYSNSGYVVPPANEDLVIRCNTFENPLGLSGAVGIHITTGTKFPSELGGDSSPTHPLPPNGNRFSGPGLANYSNANDFSYYRYTSTQNLENPGFSGNGTVTFPPTSVSPLGACGGGNGVNARPPAPLLVTTTALRDGQDRLRDAGLAPGQRDALLQLVLRYYQQQHKWTELEAYAAQLPDQDRLIYAPLTMGLMSHYEQSGMENDVRRLAASLLRRGAADADLRNYARLADLLSRNRGRIANPVFSLAASDRATLRDLASSGTGVAWQACQLLNYYEPQCTCRFPEPTLPHLATSSRTSGMGSQWLGAIYPNPAQDMVRVPYKLPAGASAVLEVRTLLGQRVASLSLAGGQGEALLPVAGLPAGVYLCSVVVEGQVVAVQRISIVH